MSAIVVLHVWFSNRRSHRLLKARRREVALGGAIAELYCLVASKVHRTRVALADIEQHSSSGIRQPKVSVLSLAVRARNGHSSN